MEEIVACVTGADRGLGLALVQYLLKQRYTVFAGTYMQESEELKALREQFPDKLTLVDLDIGDDHSVEKAKRLIIGRTDKLDVLINNAAILGDTNSTILDVLDFEEMKQVFNINTLGALRVTQALVSLILRGDNKQIVNISSEAGSIGNCNRKSWYAYSMSKSALNMQSAIVHNYIKDLGGQVLVIHPGWVKTYMRGTIDNLAELTPEQSASQIIQVVQRYSSRRNDKPVYVDYEGNELPW